MSAPLSLVIYSSVKPIFKIYFILGLGFYLAKRNILTVTTCRDIADLVVTAIMPCLIFNNIVSYLQSSDIKYIGIIFFEGTLLFVMGALLGLLTHYVCKSPKAWLGGLISVGLFPNISDLPIAYLQTMQKTGSIFTAEEGNRGVAYVCIFLASQIFYQFSLGLFKLIRYDFRDQLNDPDVEEKGGPEPSASMSEESKHQGLHDKTKLITDMPVTAPRPGSASQYSEESRSIDSVELEPKSFTKDFDGDVISEILKTPDIESLTPSGLYHTSSGLHMRPQRSSSIVIDNPLHMTRSRTADERSIMSQDMGDLIHEYSEFPRIKTRDSHRSHDAIGECESVASSHSIMSVRPPLSVRVKARVLSTLKNFLAPNSMSLIISLIIAMSPPLKALFVKASFHIPSAPDNQPPLSFIIDTASYVGAASVPLGLLVLGATIARLRVTAIIPGFWKTALMITACRLIILPVFGVGLTTGIHAAGWFGDDRLIRFVSVLEYGLPNATALIYFTAFYTDPESPDHLQMDCLAICLIVQYSILFISLPFLVTFSLKVSMGY